MAAHRFEHPRAVSLLDTCPTRLHGARSERVQITNTDGDTATMRVCSPCYIDALEIEADACFPHPDAPHSIPDLAFTLVAALAQPVLEALIIALDEAPHHVQEALSGAYARRHPHAAASLFTGSQDPQAMTTRGRPMRRS